MASKNTKQDTKCYFCHKENYGMCMVCGKNICYNHMRFCDGCSKKLCLDCIFTLKENSESGFCKRCDSVGLNVIDSKWFDGLSKNIASITDTIEEYKKEIKRLKNDIELIYKAKTKYQLKHSEK